jgi:hypothetical protein
MAIILLVVPYPFLHSMDLLNSSSSNRHVELAVVLGVTAGVVVLSGFFLRLSLFTPGQAATFDKKAGVITYTITSPARRKVDQYFQFSDISGIAVVTHPIEDSSPTFAISIEFLTGKSLTLGAFAIRSQADERLRQISRVTGHKP